MEVWNLSVLAQKGASTVFVIHPVAYSPYLVSYPSSPYTNGKRKERQRGHTTKRQTDGTILR
jgi:hypothetical protein